MFLTNPGRQEIMMCDGNEELAKCSMQGRDKEKFKKDGGKCSLQHYSK